MHLMNIFQRVQCRWSTILAAEIILFQFQTWLRVKLENVAINDVLPPKAARRDAIAD